MTTARIGLDSFGGTGLSAALSFFCASTGLAIPRLPVISTSAKAVAIVFIHASLKQYGVELSRPRPRVNRPQAQVMLLFCICNMNIK